MFGLSGGAKINSPSTIYKLCITCRISRFLTSLWCPEKVWTQGTFFALLSGSFSLPPATTATFQEIQHTSSCFSRYHNASFVNCNYSEDKIEGYSYWNEGWSQWRCMALNWATNTPVTLEVHTHPLYTQLCPSCLETQTSQHFLQSVILFTQDELQYCKSHFWWHEVVFSKYSQTAAISWSRVLNSSSHFG